MGIVNLSSACCAPAVHFSHHNLLWVSQQAVRKAPGWNNFQLQNAVAFLKPRARKHQIVIIKSDVVRLKNTQPNYYKSWRCFLSLLPWRSHSAKGWVSWGQPHWGNAILPCWVLLLDTDELNSELIEVPGLQQWVTALLSCDWWLCYQILINVSFQSLLALAICCPLAPANICLESPPGCDGCCVIMVI